MASILKVDQLQLSDGSTPTAADLGLDVAGSVVQVVQGTLGGASTYTNSSTSYVATGLSVTITPKYSNSKMYIYSTNQASSEVANTGSGFAIYKNGTGLFYPASNASSVAGGSNPYQLYSGGDNTWAPVSVDYLEDNVGTTSSVTYEVYVAGYNTTSIPYKGGGGTSTITVFEIAQ